ncbi:hypothetical protein swp_4535 [Shewanella piezotolerans WP3]|uniref:Uncharacterized protein n=1 Tax=Shewanella piezotolerans (strain WP3 / JCM 13877) TaxID=225849 RepID=B8CUI6_SHEPW|nr:hypothetical protein swp_4535 [Shewanella piezotolerans WP3]
MKPFKTSVFALAVPAESAISVAITMADFFIVFILMELVFKLISSANYFALLLSEGIIL